MDEQKTPNTEEYLLCDSLHVKSQSRQNTERKWTSDWDSKCREAGPKTEMRELSGAMEMCYILTVASYMNAFIC